MKENVKCLRCDVELRHFAREKLQLGKTGWIFGDLPNLLAGALEVEIMVCPCCRKMEFFCPEDVVTETELPQRKCPNCGAFCMPHRACKACGQYKGRAVVNVEEGK